MAADIDNTREIEIFLKDHPDAQVSTARRVAHDPVTGEEKRDLFWERMGVDSGDPEAMLQAGHRLSERRRGGAKQ